MMKTKILTSFSTKVNNFLLDTQVFIWWMEENRRLPPEIKLIIDTVSNHVFISVATPWEITIKIQAKKLKVPKNFAEFIVNGVFKILPIHIEHTLGIKDLPLYHKDPFDRILVAQAQAENFTLITSDQKIWKYPVKIMKC